MKYINSIVVATAVVFALVRTVQSAWTATDDAVFG